MICGNNDIVSRVFCPPLARTPERGHPHKNVCTAAIIIIIIIRFEFFVCGEGGGIFLGKRPKRSRAADRSARAQMLKNKRNTRRMINRTGHLVFWHSSLVGRRKLSKHKLFDGRA